ncbi:MAG: CpaD family pilus assembly protein [Sphingobium sp.]|jgi:pilus assembly protein CpaD|nr:CpaD family pilus assembly protein [Sphingobium sp.]MCI1270535.1 CpaD family pilus assembly protein [Sphingobium sp.]MCI1755416.1 CpaD family pilus assembly protein [Sphingobium sp.]MCI2053228.1 CpaD family pilus assembly protein [Sphingobium sp.]
MPYPRTRAFLSPLALIAAVGLPLAACDAKSTGNRSVESVHQPVVSYTSFVFDVRADSGVGVSRAEKERLDGWLDSLVIGYGDSVAIAGGAPAAARADITEVLGHRGLLIQQDDSAIAGAAPYGSVRLIVRRATASVPGCPDWSTKQENNMSGGTSSNYGCAVNSNFAAMVANPEDLVRGQTSNSDLRTATSNRAIQSMQAKPPTGTGGLVNLGGN